MRAITGDVSVEQLRAVNYKSWREDDAAEFYDKIRFELVGRYKFDGGTWSVVADPELGDR